MHAFKIALYILTSATALFFAFWEMKLKHQLTDKSLKQQHESVSDIDSFYEFRRDIRRERILKSLPREVLSKLRVVMSLKLLFAAIFIVEVILLQR
jgi:hypothetical protein